MNINDFMYCLQIGEEVELYIDGNCYFLQPYYEIVNKKPTIDNLPYPYTVIHDSSDYENPRPIFIGTTEEVINYKFADKYTLKEDFDKFRLVW